MTREPKSRQLRTQARRVASMSRRAFLLHPSIPVDLLDTLSKAATHLQAQVYDYTPDGNPEMVTMICGRCGNFTDDQMELLIKEYRSGRP